MTECRLVKEGGFGTERSNVVCSEEDRTIQIDELLTPYYREISFNPHKNYSSYHLFCLKKNIAPLVRFLNKDYSVVLSSKRNGNIMSMVVEVYNGSEYVKIEGEEYQYMKKSIKKALKLYPLCLLYDFDTLRLVNNDYRYRGEYHKKWATDLITDIYQMKHDRYRIIDNKLYSVDLVEYPNHEDEWYDKYIKIEKILSDGYSMGIMYLLPSERKGKFISDWNMVRYSKGTELYYPEWEFDIVKDKVSFLYDKMKGVYTFIYHDNIKKEWKKVTVKNYEDIEKLALL